jgi:hypothetical protein
MAVDENLHPDRDASATPGFERVDTVGSKASSVLSIRSNKSQDNGEYKMSGMCSASCAAPPFFPAIELPLLGSLSQDHMTNPCLFLHRSCQ